MLRATRALLPSLLLAASAAAAAAPGEAAGPPTVGAQPAAGPLAKGERPFRVRLGVLGGAAMQKTQLELGGGWDFLTLAELPRLRARLKLTVDLAIGLRPNEVSLVPMAGARFIVPLGSTPFELAVGALGGLNVTVMRGGTGVALPLRLLASGQYLLGNGLGVGLELGIDVGPLIAPFVAGYGAAHFTAVFAWGS